MTIQGTGMSTIWQMYQNASRNTVSEQDTSTEKQEKQEARQQLAVEGMNKPDRKGAPRVQAGPPPVSKTNTENDEKTDVTESDTSDLYTLEEMLQMLESSSSDTESEENSALILKRFESAYQNAQQSEMGVPQEGPPPEMPVDTNQDGMWSEEEINELIETEDLDVSASEIISHYDTDGDSLINSEERETMRADNAFNLPKPGPGGPGGGMPPVSATDTEEEEEEEVVEEITNTFIKMVEQAYLNNSRDYITTATAFDTVF